MSEERQEDINGENEERVELRIIYVKWRSIIYSMKMYTQQQSTHHVTINLLSFDAVRIEREEWN